MANEPTSERECETCEEDVRTVLAVDDVGGEGTPDVLVSRNQPDRGSQCEIIKHLSSHLVVDGDSSVRQHPDLIFQLAADCVVVEARPNAVVRSRGKKTVREQRDAPVEGDGVRARRRIPESSEEAETPKRLAARQLLHNLLRLIDHEEVLREVGDGGPTVGLVTDGKTRRRWAAQQNAEGLRRLRRRQGFEGRSEIQLRL